MAKTFKIVNDNTNISELIEALTSEKENIKDVFCAIRFTNGDLLLLDSGVPFETLCTISKKLDYLIHVLQEPEEELIFEQEESE